MWHSAHYWVYGAAFTTLGPAVAGGAHSAARVRHPSWRDGRLVVAMHGRRSKRWLANGNVVRTFGSRCAIAHPFSWPGVHPLAGLNRHLAAVELHDKSSAQHDREFVELGALPRLGPAGRAVHVGDAEPGVTGVDAPHILIDQLGRLTAGSYPARLADQFRHARKYCLRKGVEPATG